MRIMIKENVHKDPADAGYNTYTDPGVLEGVGGGDSLGGVDGQHAVDQVFGFWGDRVPFWRRILKIMKATGVNNEISFFVGGGVVKVGVITVYILQVRRKSCKNTRQCI